MNHSFHKQSLNDTCAQCGRNEIDHTENAHCECCENVGSCNLIDNMLMCETCEARDKEIKIETGQQIPDDPRANKISKIVARLGKEIPVDRRAYFVGRITAIVDIEKELIDTGIENPNYALAEIVEGNIGRLKLMISGLHQQVREAQGEIVADQKYLNQIVPQLRAEEREKFKAYDINYKPTAVIPPTTGTSKPRMSASDRAVESMANYLGCSIEQARISLSSATKNVLGATCSCKETPGICKIHNP